MEVCVLTVGCLVKNPPINICNVATQESRTEPKGGSAKLKCPKDWHPDQAKCLFISQTSRPWAEGPADCSVKKSYFAAHSRGRGIGKEFQGKCLKITSPVPPVKLYCCYMVIMVLSVAVVALSVVAFSVRKTERVPMETTYAVCLRDWIGLGSKCFYFSEYTSNWTFSQNYCKALESKLARIDNMEELNFLRRYKGTFDYWIGLHRESLKDPWTWTDSTEYNNLLPIRGEEEHAYLNDNGISSARIYADRRWICSKPNSYILQCQNPF